jgi:hypothetical protein
MEMIRYAEYMNCGTCGHVMVPVWVVVGKNVTPGRALPSDLVTCINLSCAMIGVRR